MADKDTAEHKERSVHIGSAFIADSQPAELVKPTYHSLNHPAKDAKPAAVLGVPLGDDRLDAAYPQPLPLRGGVVRTVGKDDLRATDRVADPPANQRNAVHQRDQLRHVVTVAAGQPDGQRNPISVGDDVMLRAAFPAIYRAGTGTFAPPTARTCELSTTAADRSIRSLARSRFNIALWTSSHTPASCQALRYRQQLMPEPHPISWGRSSHGMPVLSTNKIPASTLRRSNGLRPGYLNRRGFGGGKSGSITFHSSSSSNGFAMAAPPCASMTSTISTELRESFC